MRRFRFPLDPALQLRSRLEEQAQVELAESRRRLELRQEALREIERQLQRHASVRSDLQQSQIDALTLAALDPYQQELERTLALARAALQEAEAAMERAREALHQRRVDREVLERLRERRRAEHRHQELQEEQRSLDEVGVMRWRKD